MSALRDDVLKEHGTDVGRIVNLSDAVFAVAITLLVLDIGIPNIHGLSGHLLDQALLQQLYGLTGRIASYVLSFVVIGTYWHSHHRIFGYIKRYDSTLIRLNLAILLMVAFLPVPTGIIGRYGNSPVAAVSYAILLAITGLLVEALWLYATGNHRLVDTALDWRIIAYYKTRLLIAPLVFLISLPLAFVTLFEPTLPGAELAEFSWLVAALALAIHKQLYRKQVSGSPKVSKQVGV